jgi:uncharacterized protein involved in response to NO
MGPIQLGYFLLATGLILTALSEAVGIGPGTDALHLATLGGIGLVTSAMILRIDHIRERRGPGWPKMGIVVAVLLVIAADLRVTASLAPDLLMPAAMALWTLAFLLLAGTLAWGWIRTPD